jgi:hypothetical protein
MKNFWKHSILRFYIKNAIWNFKFWLFCKKTYEDIVYNEPLDDFQFSPDLKIRQKSKTHKKRRFKGYYYDGNIYLDNPGIQGEDEETMRSWMRKGLIK